MTQLEQERCLYLARQGVLVPVICTRLGVTPRQVRALLRKEGIALPVRIAYTRAAEQRRRERQRAERERGE